MSSLSGIGDRKREKRSKLGEQSVIIRPGRATQGSEVKGTQLYPTLHNHMVYTVHEILQATVLEWVAFLFSR